MFLGKLSNVHLLHHHPETQFLGGSPDELLIGIATPSSQSVVKMRHNQPAAYRAACVSKRPAMVLPQ